MRSDPVSIRPRPRFAAAALAATLVLAACEKVPGLDDPLPAGLDRKAYPLLGPLPPSLFDVPPPEEQSDAIEDDLTARARRLQSRAEALRSQQPPE